MMSSASKFRGRFSVPHMPKEPQTEDDGACIKKLPKCIIIYADSVHPRTVTMHLAVHPSVILLSSTSYFTDHYDKGPLWYKGVMPCSSPGKIVVEMCPTYFPIPVVASRIFQLAKHMKIIVVVRDPIDRALIHFKHAKHNQGSLEDYKNEFMNKGGEVVEDNPFIQQSLYYTNIIHWKEIFQTNLYVIDRDTFKHNVKTEMEKLQKFLGLPPTLTSNAFVYDETKKRFCLRKSADQTQCKSESVHQEEIAESNKPVHEDINEPQDPNLTAVVSEIKEKLKDHFTPHNEKFFEAVGQRFNWQ